MAEFYGPVSKIVFNIAPPIEPGAAAVQTGGPFTQTGFDTGTFSVLVPELAPVTPFAHVTDVIWVTAQGDDPYNGVPPEVLENLTDGGVAVGTHQLEADDADAGELVTIEADIEPGATTYTVYFFVSGDSQESPVADAGEDQAVATEDPVTLDGTGSSDPNDDTLTYAWTQVSGDAVTLTGEDTAEPTFDAPATPATLVFQLLVDDGKGGTDTDTVTVEVS